MYLYRQVECFSGLPSLSHPCVISKSSKILTSEFTNPHFFTIHAGNATQNAFFGQGRGPVLMEYVGCSGFEDSLVDCNHNGLGHSTCEHWKDAGVICQGEMLYVLRDFSVVKLSWFLRILFVLQKFYSTVNYMWHCLSSSQEQLPFIMIILSANFL